MQVITPKQLFDGYDRYKPLEVTPLRERAGDFLEQTYYFNGPIIGDKTVRVFGRLLTPLKGALSAQSTQTMQTGGQAARGKLDAQAAGQISDGQKQKNKIPVIIVALPAVDDIDTINMDGFLSMGYALFLVDYAGRMGEKSRFTIYPKDAAQWETNPQLITAPPLSPYESCHYKWTLVMLHAITFLEAHEAVDSTKIGIIGISEGTSLVWRTAFLENLCAGVTFFGGDIFSKGEDFLAYRACLDIREYTKNRFPILVNTTTNDKRNNLDFLSELCKNSDGAYLNVLINAENAVSDTQLKNTKNFFDLAFFGGCFPQKPALAINVSDGSLYAEIAAGEGGGEVSLYCAREQNDPSTRCFLPVPLAKVSDTKYLGRPEVAGDAPIHLIAQVSREDFTLTTPLVSKIPKNMGVWAIDLKQSRLVYDSAMGIDAWMTRDGGFFNDHPLVIKEGAHGLSGVCGDLLKTYKIGEYKYRGHKDSLLKIMLQAKSGEVELVLTEGGGGKTATYSCVKTVPANVWTSLSLEPKDFKSLSGLVSMEKAFALTVSGKEVIINSVLWV